MCGRCRNVFNAFESLKRIEDIEEPHDAAHTGSGEPALNTREPPEFPPLDIGNLHELAPETPPEFTAVDSDEFSPEVRYDNEQLSEITATPGMALTVAGEGVATIARPPTAGRIQEAPAFLLADPPTETSNDDEATELVEVADNPLLRPSSRLDPQPRRAIWLGGIVLLLIVALVQATYFFRATMMENYPQTRLYLVKACELAGCVISWGRNDAAIKIEASDLIESPAKPGRILLTATLVNRGKVKQELPAIEVRLTDNNNQVLASRIMQPRDYLGRMPIADEGLAPNAELFVNLNFEIANKSPASGYGLRAFYP